MMLILFVVMVNSSFLFIHLPLHVSMGRAALNKRFDENDVECYSLSL